MHCLCHHQPGILLRTVNEKEMMGRGNKMLQVWGLERSRCKQPVPWRHLAKSAECFLKHSGFGKYIEPGECMFAGSKIIGSRSFSLLYMHTGHEEKEGRNTFWKRKKWFYVLIFQDNALLLKLYTLISSTIHSIPWSVFYTPCALFLLFLTSGIHHSSQKLSNGSRFHPNSKNTPEVDTTF